MPGDWQNLCFVWCLHITDNIEHWGTMLNLRRIYRREESFSKRLFLKSPLFPFVTFRSGKRPNSALHTVPGLPCSLSGAFVAMATPWTTSTQAYNGLYVHWQKLFWATQKRKRCERKLYGTKEKYLGTRTANSSCWGKFFWLGGFHSWSLRGTLKTEWASERQ